MPRLFARLLLFAISVLTVPKAFAAEDLVRPRSWLHLNGYTRHFDAPDANDHLWGIGWTRYRQRWGRVLSAWEADAFQDSGRQFSAYFGHSWTYRMRPLEVGITGAVMYHRNFARQNRWRVLPVALPFAQVTSRSLAVRAYYIPPLRNRCDHQVAFQLMIPFAR